jgi:hypothetical protein
MKIPTMYYLVTRRLGEAMLGSKSDKGARSNTPRGTVYGIFSSSERAEAYAYSRWGDAIGLMLGNTILIVEQ